MAFMACGPFACDMSDPSRAISGEAGRDEPAALGKAASSNLPEEERTGSDWPGFLGPFANGVSDETGLLETWPASGPPILWEKQIGTGYGAPSVLGEQLVVHHRVADEEIVDSLQAATGAKIWRYAYATDYRDPYAYNNGPRCSPVLTQDRCYTFGAEGKLLCLDIHTGGKIWMRDTNAEFALGDWFFGIGCTPILEGNLLIALVGGHPDSGVVAFDAETGQTVWESVGRATWDGQQTGWRDDPTYGWTGSEQIVSYSSPIVATIHNKRHLLCLTRHGLVSLDPQDGSENFKYWFRARSHESVNAARPVVIGDKIFLSAAYKVGSALLQVNPDGKSCRELWRNRRNMLTHWSTAIHVDGTLYGFSGRHENEGTFRAIDLETGKVGWSSSGFAGDMSSLTQDRRTGAIKDRATGKAIPFPFFGRGSMIKVQDRFIVLGERGTLALVEINPHKFEELSRTAYKQIGYPAWAAPVLSRKRLFLRAEESLLCLDLAVPPQER